MLSAECEAQIPVLVDVECTGQPSTNGVEARPARPHQGEQERQFDGWCKEVREDCEAAERAERRLIDSEVTVFSASIKYLEEHSALANLLMNLQHKEWGRLCSWGLRYPALGDQLLRMVVQEEQQRKILMQSTEDQLARYYSSVQELLTTLHARVAKALELEQRASRTYKWLYPEDETACQDSNCEVP